MSSSDRADGRARSHLAQAQAALEAGDHRGATSHIRDGLDAGPSPPIRRRLLLSATLRTAEESGHEEAFRELDEIAAQARAASDAELIALCAAQRGSLNLRAGDIRAAKAALDTVNVDHLAALDRVRCLLNRGTLTTTLEPGEGAADLRRAVDQARAAGLDDSEFRGLHNLGYVSFLQGDLPQAMRLMREADAMEVETDRSVALLDLAQVLHEAGLLNDARTTLLAAQEAAHESQARDTEVAITLELARVDLLAGNTRRAAAQARDAHQQYAHRGATAYADRAEALLWELSIKDDRVETPASRGTAEEALRELIKRAQASGDVPASINARLILVEYFVATKRPQAARDALSPLVSEAALVAQLSDRLRLLGLQAHIALLEENVEDASACLEAASNELAQARLRPASLDLRSAIASHAQPLAQLDIATAQEPLDLLARSERWRAGADHFPPVAPLELSASAEALLRQLRGTREEIRMTPPGVDITELVEQARSIEVKLRRLDWGHESGIEHQTTPCSYEQIISELQRHDCAMISFVASDENTIAVACRPGRDPTAVDLGPTDQIEAQVTQVLADAVALTTLGAPGPLRSVVRASLQSSTSALGESLLTPVADYLAELPLVIIPSRGLANVAWGMLPGSRGRPVTVARSASAWTRASEKSANTKRPTPTNANVAALAGPGLRFASQEAKAVGSIWEGVGAQVQLAPAQSLSPASFTTSLETHDLVHVVAHGTHDVQSPLFSFIRTSQGPCFAHEIPDGLFVEHVTLAACEGGRATLRPGDEPLGLAATLLARGAHCVVTPTMIVGDAQAHEVVLNIHQNLATGATSAEAVASANAAAPLEASSFTSFGGPWSFAQAEQ